MQNVDECISEVWACEQDILDVIHKICTEHNLRYSLMFGTLLGAVRHGGFIPWDDDIDILMPREDYEQLLAIWKEEAPEGYLLQNKRTDEDFTQNFSKIRRDHTTFIQDEAEKAKKYHTGIFVDIFVADRVAPEGIWRKIQYFACAVNLLYAREFRSGNGGAIGMIERMLLCLPHKARVTLYHKSERFISKWVKNAGVPWFSPNTIIVCKRYFDSDIFENMTTVGFNGKEYCCVKDADKLLTKIYGDYMKLPPKEDRVWKHHPIVVDFEHNYYELQKDEWK